MDNLASLQERINQAVADKVIGKILETEARNHFNHGFKSSCKCTVCECRRKYAYLQSLPNSMQGRYRSVYGVYLDVRSNRKELHRAFKKKVLRGSLYSGPLTVI